MFKRPGRITEDMFPKKKMTVAALFAIADKNGYIRWPSGLVQKLEWADKERRLIRTRTSAGAVNKMYIRSNDLNVDLECEEVFPAQTVPLRTDRAKASIDFLKEGPSIIHRQPVHLPDNWNDALKINEKQTDSTEAAVVRVIMEAASQGRAIIQRNLREWPYGKELSYKINAANKELEFFWKDK